MLKLFLRAGIDNLVFEECFELFLIRKIDELIKFLFVNGETCFFVGPLTQIKSGNEFDRLFEVSFEDDFPKELDLFRIGKEVDLR